MQNVKFHMVGDSDVGKTCILITHTTGKFPESDQRVFDAYSEDMTVMEKRIRLQLWDVSGSELHDRIRPLGYPHTDVFILCFSLINPSSYASVRSRWKPELDLHCPGTPIVLVGTKLDMREDAHTISQLREKGMTPITESEGRNLAKDINAGCYIECSALAQTNIQKIFDESFRILLRPKKGTKNSQECTIQ
eukprot:TRINITY_DN14641_c0_g1_i1.p1 TRINITY_DN14641_c0_g1~~TRINITY_DN14641_c0_g1_i1.p1  ORF type:complete len:192 (+),score=31.48 TRINITY_DN14641_c0_g1_i1:76-651(+)